MKFFVMSHIKEPGCPGYVEAFIVDKGHPHLCDHFHADSERCKRPIWHRRSEGEYAPVFQPGMIAVSWDPRWRFDIRSADQGAYFASDRFMEVCRNAGVGFVDQSPLTVRSKRGVDLVQFSYSAVIFKELDVLDVAATESLLVRDRTYGNIHRVKKLVVRDGFVEPIFRFKGMSGSSHTLICSEEFRQAAGERLRGLEFIDIDGAIWPHIKII
ncbi:hypothetical protein [Stenotrophomonas sp.]|uniref:imm11 family protein n=1 Tax=Stenotrophomonas sp. TaxID=69392 RepID=UPI0028AA70B1|nr:hypothetical protein [Stenotrophomonas sp.]